MGYHIKWQLVALCVFTNKNASVNFCLNFGTGESHRYHHHKRRTFFIYSKLEKNPILMQTKREVLSVLYYPQPILVWGWKLSKTRIVYSPAKPAGSGPGNETPVERSKLF